MASWHPWPSVFKGGATRRVRVCAVVLVFLWGGLAAAAGSRDRAVTEALGDFFPQADSYEATTHDFDGRTLEAHTAKAAGAVVGWAIRLEEMGKRYPIVFFVGLNPQGEVVGVRVLEYRDVFGKRAGRPSFLRQFRGKTMKDTLRIGQDIDAVTHATISSGAAVKAVRRSLEFFKEHLAEERK